MFRRSVFGELRTFEEACRRAPKFFSGAVVERFLRCGFDCSWQTFEGFRHDFVTLRFVRSLNSDWTNWWIGRWLCRHGYIGLDFEIHQWIFSFFSRLLEYAVSFACKVMTQRNIIASFSNRMKNDPRVIVDGWSLLEVDYLLDELILNKRVLSTGRSLEVRSWNRLGRTKNAILSVVEGKVCIAWARYH